MYYKANMKFRHLSALNIINVVNNVDMLSLRAPWQNGQYKYKHTEQHNTLKYRLIFFVTKKNDSNLYNVNTVKEINIHVRCVNINWRDVQTNNVANNVDMSCLRAPWQNGPYKN